MSLVGQKINNYHITAKIGEGGMGTVYLAVHELLNTKVAIKALHPALCADNQLRSRFLTEASTLSSLNHAYIVRILDFTQNRNGLFIIMEYVQGLTLDELIKTKTGPMPEARAFKIFEKMLEGFQYAHNRTPLIIHRDIKPANILITEEDDPKVIDFGIVKILNNEANISHTTTGTKIGTPAFMSPEQILGKELDSRSDIYSLGITLFVMLTGRSPYSSNLSEYEIQENIIRNPLPPASSIYPGVSAMAESIIEKATAKSAEHRFASCNEFKQALIQPLQKTYIRPAQTIPASVSPPPVVKKKKNINLIVGVLIFIIIGLSAYFIIVNYKKSSTTNTISSTSTENNPSNNNTNNPNNFSSNAPSNTSLNNNINTENTANNKVESSPDIKPNSEQTTPAEQVKESSGGLSDEQIQSLVTDYYKSEDSRDWDQIKNFYSSNVRKYFKKQNPGIDYLEKVYRNAWEKTSGSKNTPKTFSVIERGQETKVEVILDFEAFKLLSQEWTDKRNQSSIIVFNSEGRIVEVYDSTPPENK